MIINLDITFKSRATNGRTAEGWIKETRHFTIDSEDMPLILAEAMDSNDFGMMRHAITDFLELTPAESKQITVGHLKKIGQAMKSAQEVPNA